MLCHAVADMNEVTRILSDVQRGDPRAAAELLPLVYEELRKLAARRMATERADHTLEATALVHEAYLRLVDVDKDSQWNSRGHFFGAAAEAMRRILVENARANGRLKRGGGGDGDDGWQRVELSVVEVPGLTDDVLALHEALEKLESLDPRTAQLVKLRFFAGLTNEQAADVLEISPSTAYSDWAYARCWLRLEISGESPEPPARCHD
jgi:RNA polymerase sigma factor (TIGR02999 family)